ncbi:hypothetical protein BD769DRAFT_413570 [Suillus cothurnatus]|nr:hypothetical protein BD769DRAFT_413570 [Suillus cothurnatus]
MACGSAHLHLSQTQINEPFTFSPNLSASMMEDSLSHSRKHLRLRRRSTFFTSSFLRNDLHYSLYLLHSFSKHPQLTRHGLVPSQRPRSPTMLLSRRVQISLSLLCRLLYWTRTPCQLALVLFCDSIFRTRGCIFQSFYCITSSEIIYCTTPIASIPSTP